MSLEDRQSALVAERRKQIFEAAIKVFARKGYHAATVSEIAREAGLGKGTLYEYIRSKKEMLFLVAEEGHAMILAEIDEIAKQDLSPLEKWRGAISVQLRLMDRYKETATAVLPQILGMSEHENSRLVQMNEKYIEKFSTIYEEGVAAGVFRQVDSMLLNVLVCNFCVLWGNSPEMREYCGSVDKFEDFLMDVIFKGIIA
ncbi:MAG TPA: TetR/AcrR family transcriptional regulator [bacterium]|nr:TetR/AcrR family transcriptional regulator [bacterium]